MLLYYRQKQNQLNLSDHEMFETAYVWRFGHQGYVTPDYCAFVQHGVLPKYLVAWMQFLQGEDNATNHVHQVRPGSGDTTPGRPLQLNAGDQEALHSTAVLDVGQVPREGGQEA